MLHSTADVCARESEREREGQQLANPGYKMNRVEDTKARDDNSLFPIIFLYFLSQQIQNLPFLPVFNMGKTINYKLNLQTRLGKGTKLNTKTHNICMKRIKRYKQQCKTTISAMPLTKPKCHFLKKCFLL